MKKKFLASVLCIILMFGVFIAASIVAAADEELTVPGDFMRDGEVNTKDIILLRQYLARYDYDNDTPPFELPEGSDVNGDGVINTKDITLLRDYLVGIQILQQPDVFNDYTVYAGDDANYAWYLWTDGAIGDAVEGANTATLTGATDGLSYVCVVSYGPNSVVSEPVLYMSDRTHPACGEICECEDETHENITWTPIVSLDEFKKAMEIGGNYYLGADIAVDESVYVKADTNLCLNGKKLSSTGGNFSMLRVAADVTLTLADCSDEERVGYIDPETGLWNEGVYTGEGTATEHTLYGGVITGGSSNLGGAIYANGNLNLYNVNFAGNKASSNGGAIDLVGGVMTAKGDNVFVGNTAVGHAGAIYVTYATEGPTGVLNMNGGTFAYNSAMGGGAVSIRSSCEASFDGSTFIGNSVSGYQVDAEGNGENDGDGEGGGAIYVGYGALTLNNVTMTGNTSEYVGGAVNALKSDVSVIDGSFNNNEAVRGGAFNIINNSTVVFTGTTFSENIATGEANTEGGGAINSEESALTLSAVTMDGNSAGYYGGAINARKGTVVINDNTVIKNSKGATGAALYFREAGTSVTIIDATISDNTATNNGVIYMTQAGTLTVDRLTATGNDADQGGVFYVSGGTITLNNVIATGNNAKNGGVLYAGGANITVNDSTFGEAENGNTASKDGGAIYSASGSTTVNASNISGNVTTANGGAIFVKGGSVTVGNDTVLNGNNATVGGAIYAEGGSVTLDGGVVLGDNNAENGGAIYAVNGAEVNLAAVTLQNNVATTYGGAISVEGATLNLGTGTILEGNSAGSFGGALYIHNYTYEVDNTPEGAEEPVIETVTLNANVTVDGASFNNNTALRGGAIYVAQNEYTITNSQLLGNSATELNYGGGAIYSTESTGNLSEVTFVNNTSHKGGAVALHSGSEVNVSSMTAIGNQATLNSEEKLGVGGVFYLNNATLNLVKGEFDTIIFGSSVEGEGNTAVDGGVIYAENNAVVTIVAAEFIGNSATNYGGAIYAKASELAISGDATVFNANTSTNLGGAIFVTGSDVELTDVEMSENSATNNGGAFYVTSSTVTINGGSFTKNTAVLGGAVYAVNESQLTIENVEFSENIASNHGGAIGAYNADLIISGENTVFNANTAAKYGGAIYLSNQTVEGKYEGATLIMTDGTFSENTAFAGGAINGRTNSEMSITGTLFSNNSVTAETTNEGGGAIYQGYGKMTLVNVDMIGNTATVYGGAIVAVGNTVIVTGGEFKDNSAARGGAINALESTMSFTGTKFTTNSATRNSANTDGGGAINAEKGTLTLSGVIMDGNTSKYYGGAINARKGIVEIKDGTVITNSQGGTGAALYFREAGTTVTITDSTVSNNTATANGVIYMTSAGTLTVNGLTVSGNNANNGGVFYLSGGTTTFSGVVATDNVAKTNGNLLYISAIATIKYETDEEKAVWENNTYATNTATVTYESTQQ